MNNICWSIRYFIHPSVHSHFPTPFQQYLLLSLQTWCQLVLVMVYSHRPNIINMFSISLLYITNFNNSEWYNRLCHTCPSRKLSLTFGVHPRRLREVNDYWFNYRHTKVSFSSLHLQHLLWSHLMLKTR